MATATKKTESPDVDYTTLNVFQKLQIARVMFLNAGTSKSGVHIKLEYKYFELADIVPTATNIFNEVGLLMVPTIKDGLAMARVYNSNDPEDYVDFYAPYTPISTIVSNAGNQVTNEMQATGSSITYIRRYLWQLVLDIIESDSIDSGEHDTTTTSAPKSTKKTPVTAEKRQEIKKELTNPATNADELQVKALKTALKNLMELDSEQESFVQSIAVKTEGFTNLSKEACEQLINGVAEMIAAYSVPAQEG